MDQGKDYVWSLNRGLFNTFKPKYVEELLEHVRNAVLMEEKLPTRPNALLKWACDIVDEEVNGRFKIALVKQILRSIAEAPPKSDDGTYEED